MGMILRIASSRIVGQGDIVGRSGYFSLNLSANSVMRGRLDARRTLKSLVADLRIDKIVKPVISDGACRSLILQNKDFYMDLINTAGDDAYELKKSLRNLIQKDSDPQLVKFVNSIDSVPEVETA